MHRNKNIKSIHYKETNLKNYLKIILKDYTYMKYLSFAKTISCSSFVRKEICSITGDIYKIPSYPKVFYFLQ